jgi:type I restriction enzyme, S subunit
VGFGGAGMSQLSTTKNQVAQAGFTAKETHTVTGEVHAMVALHELCSEIIDCPHSTPIWTDQGVVVLRNQNIKQGRLDISEPSYTDETHFAQRTQRAIPSYGDLVITREAPMGDVCMIPASLRCCLGQRMVLLRLNPKVVEPAYLLYALQSTAVQNSIRVQGGTGSTVSNLRIPVLAGLQIPLPLFTEQKLIARALSDIDALIKALEGTIGKKRHIKQGAMQELLSVKSGWIEKKLGETAILKARIGWQGLTTDEYLDSGNFYLVTGTEFKNGFIEWDKCHFVEEERYKQDKNIQLREEDILVTKDGTIGKVALVNFLEVPATLNSGVFVIRPLKDSFSPRFFYYLLRSSVFTEFLGQLSAGSTINHLYQKDFVNFIYQTPQSLEEQEAIATILSDMDTEIATLEAKLTKTRQLKQGMMHELLTGRIRLV